MAGKDICRYCRWWNDEKRYFNHVFDDKINTGGTVSFSDQTAPVTAFLYDTETQGHKGYAYTLKVDAKIHDLVSDEVQTVTKYIDFQPEVMLGLSGQPYERLYSDGKKNPLDEYLIEGTLTEGDELVDSLSYEVYFYSYDLTTEVGIDRNVYFLNAQQYVEVAS